MRQHRGNGKRATCRLDIVQGRGVERVDFVGGEAGNVRLSVQQRSSVVEQDRGGGDVHQAAVFSDVEGERTVDDADAVDTIDNQLGFVGSGERQQVRLRVFNDERIGARQMDGAEGLILRNRKRQMAVRLNGIDAPGGIAGEAGHRDQI